MTGKVSLRLKEGEQNRVSLLITNSEFLNDSGFVLSEPIHTDVLVSYEEFGIVINVTAKGVLELICSRCACAFQRKLNLEHSIIIADTEKGWTLDQDTIDMRVIDLKEGTVDVVEIIRQLIYEGLEMQPLCREDCKGLCSVCGQNLNEGQCQCTGTYTDPRFAKLKELLKE